MNAHIVISKLRLVRYASGIACYTRFTVAEWLAYRFLDHLSPGSNPGSASRSTLNVTLSKPMLLNYIYLHRELIVKCE